MKKINVVITMVMLLSAFFIVSPAFAGQCAGGNQDASCNKICSDASIADDVKKAAGCSDSSTDTVPVHLENIINVAISAVGIIAVLVIVIGGQRLATSSGDPQKVTQAKNMIIYAVVAIIIASLAYAIVTFVGTSIGK